MGKKEETPHRVVDEQWLTEQVDRIKFVQDLKPRDRLDLYAFLQTTLQISSSQLKDIYGTVAVSEIALSIDEKLYKHLFEEVRSITLAIMTLNSEMTRKVPTKGVGEAKTEDAQKEKLDRLFT